MALQCELDENGQVRILGYALPARGTAFENVELQAIYAQATKESNLASGKKDEILDSFFCSKGQVPRPDTPAVSVLASKKYKPVDKKVRPVLTTLPSEFRIERNITGDPLKDMPTLNPRPPPFQPGERYTAERKEIIDKAHEGNALKLWPEEKALMHDLMLKHERVFAWDASERGQFKEEFFPPIKFPVVEHTPWVLKNIPIPAGQYEEVCRIIKEKIDANVYEPSNSSYRSRWFCVIKKDGKSLRMVQSLEPLNAVTIAHSGVPPATDALAEHFTGRSCLATFDLFVGYDNRTIHPDSRDYTTIQTPFGPLRLVKLPMGWTNSVPIFHDDVTYIFADEIPEVTIPYIDDVPVRGPESRYELPGGGYETIPENPGIRKFVWEQFQNLNRICQRMYYAGGTFSGMKTILCGDEIMVVGHLCGYQGRRIPSVKAEIIKNWAPCKDLTDVRAFMGTAGVFRIYIKDYAKRMRPINELTRKGVEFEWTATQQAAMEDIKQAIMDSGYIRPLRYHEPGAIVLAVDTSWNAVGFYIYQEDPEDKKKKYYARFGSITLNAREAAYGQAKRELYGLLRALRACKTWLFGCRKLIVEMDASFIVSMINNPGEGMNATVNRWVDEIRRFQFSFRHVPGSTFGADGLSRRRGQEGDEEFEPYEDTEEDDGKPFPVEFTEGGSPSDIIPYEKFRDTVDTRRGYLLETFGMESMEELVHTLLQPEAEGPDLDLSKLEKDVLEPCGPIQTSFPQILPPEEAIEQPYPEDHRSSTVKRIDDQLELIWGYLFNQERPAGKCKWGFRDFLRLCSHYLVDETGRLFRRDVDNNHRAVVWKKNRMYVLKAAHDLMTHRGVYATTRMISRRLWWPGIEEDVIWFIKTCHLCQTRKHVLVLIPPSVTYTPHGIFEQIHIDTLFMPPSHGCKYILHGRCALTSYSEARAVTRETGKTIALWLLEDFICRWGCPKTIVTDNGKPFVAALEWLKEKYGIRGIQISPYNSQANGKIERGHFDLRKALFNSCNGETRKWYSMLHYVLWADRVTVKKRLGMSPYQMVTGKEPVLPLDIEQATWLVKPPTGVTSTEELVAKRSQQLAKHAYQLAELREKIIASKRKQVLDYELKNKHKIKSFVFEPGDLVLIRNTVQENSYASISKFSPRYLGPMVVLKRTVRGAYIVCELDGSVVRSKIGRFRVIPYFARRKIDLPENVLDLIGITAEQWEAIESGPEPDDEEGERRLDEEILDDNLYDSDEELPGPENDIEPPTTTQGTTEPRETTEEPDIGEERHNEAEEVVHREETAPKRAPVLLEPISRPRRSEAARRLPSAYDGCIMPKKRQRRRTEG